MDIVHITIENFGGLCFYEAEFSPELNWIGSSYADQIAAAIGFLLCGRAAPIIPETWIGEDTCISAGVRLEDAVYTVCGKPVAGQLQLYAADPSGADATDRYRYALCHCTEQDDVEVFDGQDRMLPDRLYRYYCGEEDDLSGRTQRISDTKTFHSQLCGYIRGFQPESINSRKNYHLAISAQGQFRVFHPEIPGEVYLSETEEKLFRYLCFLHIATFWAEFQQLRDLHHEKKPLLIRNFVECLDQSVNISGLLARTRKLHRQILIFTTGIYGLGLGWR